MAQVASTIMPTNPEDQAYAGRISRRRRLADALMTKEPLPMGQMVGNRFVPTPWTMGLANAIGDIASAWENRQADKEEKELATGRVDRSRKALSDQLDSLRVPTDENDPRFAPYDLNAIEPKSPFPGAQNFSLEGPKLDINAALREQQNVVPKVNVVGQYAPGQEFTDPIKAQRLQMLIEALDSGMAPEQVSQLNLQQQLADLAPQKLGQGDVIWQPGQGVRASNPKPVEERPAQFIESGAGTDAQGRPLTIKKRYDPEKGAVDIPGVLPETRGPLVNNTNTVGMVEKEEGKAKGKRNIDVLLNDAELAESASAKSLPKLKSMLDINSKIKTGWDSPTREAFSAGLNAIGIKDAAKYATNAETFRAFMNDQVLQEQIAQKGPQTESDARRLEQTQARLTNTNEANDFLIRFRIAQQNSSVERAKFYRKYWDQNKTLEGVQEAYDQGPGSRSLFDDPILSPYGEGANVPQKSSSSRAAPPSPGAIVDGYRFKGGNPNDANSWERVK